MTPQEEFLLKQAHEINQHGWKLDAFDKDTFLLFFPDGLPQAAQVFLNFTFKEFCNALNQKDVQDLGVTAKVKCALLTRFEVLKPYQGIEKALFHYFLTNPISNLKKTKFLYTLVDEIWHFAGDKSLDWNFYSKRFLLFLVYTRSFLVFLEDKTENLDLTKESIDRNLALIGKIPKIKNTVLGFFSKRGSKRGQG